MARSDVGASTRRPTGEVPALPRQAGWGKTVAWGAAVLVGGLGISTALRTGIADPSGTPLLRAIVDEAPAWLLDVSRRFDVVGAVAVVGALRVATLLVAAVYRRWRHLVVSLVAFVVTDWTVLRVLGVDRPPPSGLAPATDRATFWFPSRPVAAVAVTLAGMVFVLVPAGRVRSWALAVAAVVTAAYALARLVLAADYPLDAAYASLLGASMAASLFAAFVPDDAFPIRYTRHGVAAHLELDGARSGAIVAAMSDQAGLTVTRVEPFGLEGSGGSSPLRMTVEEPPFHLFGKIYSRSHLRADRWYRLGRTLLYGQLEDEVPFGSVRRLVEYEDYALRLLADDGVRVARTYGIVELVANREYLLVTEFFEDAATLGEADVDDTVIDEGLGLVRTFWDRGLAHRDIKPANLLVRGGHLQLVDVSGLEVRPSGWRQAVDLANMMLTLSLRTDPDVVYRRSLRLFTPEEVAEAFAADVGLAMPTQLRSSLGRDPRPIAERFRQLAPARPRISIQRWSTRRLALLGAVAASAVVLSSMFVDALVAGLR